MAPRPVPTMIAIGVARPSAHGQAMISTATALTSASARRGCGPQTLQPTNASSRDEHDGRHEECRDAIRQPLNRRAASLRLARPSGRSAPAASRCRPARREPAACRCVLIVPPVTRDPGAFSTGIGSPVTIDSSIALRPSMTTPSTGTFSPGRTRQTSPTCTSSSGTSASSPSPDDARGFRREPEQLLESPCRCGAGAKLEDLPEQDQRR